MNAVVSRLPAQGPTFQSKLRAMHACGEAIRWVGDRDLETAWAQCHKGNWMLWLAARVPIDHKLIVLAACDCANEAWPYCDDDTLTAVMLCDHITREWCEGRADIEDVRAARECAYAADAAAYAAYAAAYAAAAAAAAYAAAAYAAADAAAAAAAAYAAAYAAAAAAAAYAAAAYADADAYDADADAYDADADAYASANARAKARARCADLVRARIPVELIRTAMEAKEAA